MAFGFIALAFLPLPEAMMIGYAAPLMVVALAAFMLSEATGVYRWTATAVGFVGIVIILWPRLTFFEEGAGRRISRCWAQALALASAFSSAFAAIFIRTMTRTESTGSIVLYFSLSGIAARAAVAALRLGSARRQRTPRCSSRSACSAASARS